MPLLKNVPAEAPPPAPKRKIIDSGFLILLGFSAVAGVVLMVREGIGRVWEITLDTLLFLAILSPKVGAGIFVAAALPLVLPRDKIGQWIGSESGVRGLVMAMAAGAALPGGPAMTFPLAAGFALAGADLGAVISFVSGWCLLSLNRTLIWEFSFLPADLVWTRYLLCLPVPLVLGLVARMLELRRTA